MTAIEEDPVARRRRIIGPESALILERRLAAASNAPYVDETDDEKFFADLWTKHVSGPKRDKARRRVGR